MGINHETKIEDIVDLLSQYHGEKGQLKNTKIKAENGGGGIRTFNRALHTLFFMILHSGDLKYYYKYRTTDADSCKKSIAGFLLERGNEGEAGAINEIDLNLFKRKCDEIFNYSMSLYDVEENLSKVDSKTSDGEKLLKDGHIESIKKVIKYMCGSQNVDGEEKMKEMVKKYAKQLKNSKNIIFHGAPGTGKTYLAKMIAAYTIGNGDEFPEFSEFEKAYKDGKIEGLEDQFAFVQFHPSYDYTDFIEGLRPTKSTDGSVSFELKDGIFKAFIKEAKKEDNKNKKFVFLIDEINRGEISKILGELFFSIDPGYRGEKGAVSTQYFNMHEKEEDKKLYIPENVYIIGTMNDIDRSVDSFDFAMRRRFRFIEITAEATMVMLDSLTDKDRAEPKMKALNQEIEKTEGLGKNYQIGAAYFMKLDSLEAENDNEKFEFLWTDYLEPLLHDYVRGLPDEDNILDQMRNAYNSSGIKKSGEGSESKSETEDEPES